MSCLVYVDPSPRGEWALALAALLPSGFAPAMALLATEEDVRQDPALLPRARGRLAVPGREVRGSTRPGPAEQAIAREVAEQRHELVIVPPAGRSAIQRMLKGSRIATVVKSVQASVLIARRPPSLIDRVLVALSGGATSRAVVVRSLALCRAVSAKATFLHVASEVALPFKPPARDAGAGAPPVAEHPEEAVRAVLREFGEEPSLLVREGIVVDEVLGEVENGAYPLLVIGSPTGAEGPSWARDDLTERIILNCPASILVVRG